jgi:hypothetical protein
MTPYGILAERWYNAGMANICPYCGRQVLPSEIRRHVLEHRNLVIEDMELPPAITDEQLLEACGIDG